MSHSRFIVIKLKDIIKTTVFILAALILLTTLIIFLNKAVFSEARYTPGTYTSVMSFGEEEVTVNVTVNKNRIKDITVSKPSETVTVFYPLLSPSAEDVCSKVMEAQSTDVEVSLTNPVTESLVLDAIRECISLAEK
ncbi:MAG: hypothetical protein E7235_04560 [Lachnospiraceae bacterium]|nr:hypothetical protein [Lachnospiraceae bacterium]